MPFKLRRGGRDNEEVEIGAKDVIGMTEEELKTSLDKIKTVDEIKTNQETQGTALEAIKNSLAALEGRLPKQQEQQGDGNQEEVDPVTQLARFAANTSLETKMEVVKGNLKNKTDKDGSPKYPYWDDFEADMLKLTEKDPLVSKTQEVYWDNVYSIIFARRYKDIQAGTIKAKKTMYIETGSSMSGNQQQTDKNEPTELDKKQAEKFHIPIEKYMETKKNLVFQR